MASYSVKETAAAMRKALKTAFPGVKFSVRMATGTAYGWIDVAWADGPSDTQVRQITRVFQDSYYDGMSDCYRHTGGEWNCCGVNSHRSITEEGMEAARRATGHSGPLEAQDVITAHGVSTRPAPWRLTEAEALTAWAGLVDLRPLMS